MAETPVIHYGGAVTRAACGLRAVNRSTDPRKVTCLSCKKTLKWKMKWWS